MIRRKISICEWQKVTPCRPENNSIVGLAIGSDKNGVIHGLRHEPKNNTNGWYIWTGDYSNKKDFFKPVCLEHLHKSIELDLIEYLDLPPGFRFIIDGNNYEDVWYDEDLLK